MFHLLPTLLLDHLPCNSQCKTKQPSKKKNAPQSLSGRLSSPTLPSSHLLTTGAHVGTKELGQILNGVRSPDLPSILGRFRYRPPSSSPLVHLDNPPCHNLTVRHKEHPPPSNGLAVAVGQQMELDLKMDRIASCSLTLSTWAWEAC